MRILPSVLLTGLMLAVAVGCEKGKTTAPGTDPSRPGEARRLSVTSPGEQIVTQDQTDEMTISIDRDNFDGPVAIDLQNLPKGVSVVTKEMTIPAGKDSLTVTVKAAPDATVVDNHKVRVSAKATDQKDLKEATVEFDLDVKAKG